MGPWEKAGSEERSLVSAGGFPVAQIIDGEDLQAVMTDAQGTPLQVVDEAGNIKSKLETDIYGHEVDFTGTRDLAHQWLGVARSHKLGLVSTAGRFYEERSTAFLQPEPLLLGPSSVGVLSDPYHGNPYSYARFNGIGLADPSGYWDGAGAVGWFVGVQQGAAAGALKVRCGIGRPRSKSHRNRAMGWRGFAGVVDVGAK